MFKNPFVFCGEIEGAQSTRRRERIFACVFPQSMFYVWKSIPEAGGKLT